VNYAVKPTVKTRQKTDFSKIYTANIYVPLLRAMSEYLLESRYFLAFCLIINNVDNKTSVYKVH